MKRIAAFAVLISMLFGLTGCTLAEPELSPLPEYSEPIITTSAPPPSQSPVPTIPSPTPEPTPTPDPLSSTGRRMRDLTTEDLNYFTPYNDNISAQQLVDALNGAAGHEIDLPEGLPYTFYSLYVPLGPSSAITNGEHFFFHVGLQENLIYMWYRDPKGNTEDLYLEDSNLYWLIRNSYHTPVHIEEEAFARYRSVLEARAQQTVDTAVNVLEQPAFTGYDIVTFEYVDSFERDSATYTLYNWNVAFPTDDPANICWAGGMQLDTECRVLSYEQATNFVVKTDASGQEEYRFLYWMLYWGETHEEQRENALNRIVEAFSAAPGN